MRGGVPRALLSAHQREEVYGLREYGYSVAEIARCLGIEPMLCAVAQSEQRLVSNAALRRACLAQPGSVNRIAGALGWSARRDHFQADDSRVKRILGITGSVTRKRGREYHSRTVLIDMDLALMIGEILGLDPHELDL